MCDEGPSHRAGDWGLEVENPAYDPEFLHKQDFKAIGREIWWDNRLSVVSKKGNLRRSPLSPSALRYLNY